MPRKWTVEKLGDPQVPVGYSDAEDPIPIDITIQITNTDPSTLFFQATVPTPPLGYTITTQNLGSVAAQSSGTFLYTGIKRALPTADADETITLRVSAFTDAAFTNPYGTPSADLALTIELVNYKAATLVDKDDFDEAIGEGWAVLHPGAGANDFITRRLSHPYAWTMKNGGVGFTWQPADWFFRKSFTIGAVGRAFIFLHVFQGYDTEGFGVKIGGSIKLDSRSAFLLGLNKWLRLGFRLPVNATTQVSYENLVAITTGQGNPGQVSQTLDEIWVVTKA